MDEELEFPTRKLWGLFSIGKPMILSEEAVILRGHKIYYSDITSIEKNDKWKHDINYCPVALTVDTGKQYRVNLGNYQVHEEKFFEALVDHWRKIKKDKLMGNLLAGLVDQLKT